MTKSDLTTGVELNGASLSVLDEDGNVIDSWTSVKDEPHVIKYLTVGKTYILRESLAPLGYLKTTDVKFTIEDTAEIQKVGNAGPCTESTADRKQEGRIPR